MHVRLTAVLIFALVVGIALVACESGHPNYSPGYLNENIEPCVPFVLVQVHLRQEEL